MSSTYFSSVLDRFFPLASANAAASCNIDCVAGHYVLIGALLAVAANLRLQVGHPPDHPPYHLYVPPTVPPTYPPYHPPTVYTNLRLQVGQFAETIVLVVVIQLQSLYVSAMMVTILLHLRTFRKVRA